MGYEQKLMIVRNRIAAATQAVRNQLAEGERNKSAKAEDEEVRVQWEEEREKYENEMRQAEADALYEILRTRPSRLCAEASRRVTGMRHFDSQMLGGIVLHQGKLPR
jgi:preprotein translocase subunit SecA